MFPLAAVKLSTGRVAMRLEVGPPLDLKQRGDSSQRLLLRHCDPHEGIVVCAPMARLQVLLRNERCPGKKSYDEGYFIAEVDRKEERSLDRKGASRL